MNDSRKPGPVREIDCDEVMRQLFDFLDDEVDETADREIHAHIDECRSCFTRVEFERVLKERVRSSKEEALPDSMQQRITELMKSFSIDKVEDKDKGGRG